MKRPGKMRTDRESSFARVGLVSAVILGFGLSSACWLATYTFRLQIEKAAQSFLRAEVERRVSGQLAQLQEGDNQRSGQILLDTLGVGKARLIEQLNSEYPKAAAQAWAELCGVDCEDRKRERTHTVEDKLREEIANIASREVGLVSFIKSEYSARRTALVSELRLFSGINALLFAICGGLLVMRMQNMRVVFLPTLTMALATLFSASLYMFGQDWFWVVLTGDHIGAGYLLMVGIVSGLAVDILFFKAVVTQGILSLLPDVFVPTC